MLVWINGPFGAGKTHTAHENLVSKRLTGPIIVPMTIVEPMYLRETVGRLREQGHDARHSRFWRTGKPRRAACASEESDPQFS